jgi:hypothetical protein
MIKTKTVFVLGAGASLPYGFPSGEGLIEKIVIAAMNIRNGSVTAFSNDLREKFFEMGQHLGTIGTMSIDSWLEKNPSYSEIGKIAIAYIIGGCERPFGYYQTRKWADKEGIKAKDWFSELWSSYLTPDATLQTLCENQVQFITFNYDRSLEFYLYEKIKATYTGFTTEAYEKTANEFCNKIIHVHGQAGLLPWQADKREIAKRRYAHNIKWNEAVDVSKGILTIHEAEQDSQEYDTAKDVLAAAQKVYFLGFAYHKALLSRLQFQPSDSHVEISGTALGLSPRDRRFVQRGKAKNEWGFDISLDDNGDDTLDFIRTWVDKV